jgi:hypothetical protein
MNTFLTNIQSKNRSDCKKQQNYERIIIFVMQEQFDTIGITETPTCLQSK